MKQLVVGHSKPEAVKILTNQKSQKPSFFLKLQNGSIVNYSIIAVDEKYTRHVVCTKAEKLNKNRYVLHKISKQLLVYFALSVTVTYGTFLQLAAKMQHPFCKQF